MASEPNILYLCSHCPYGEPFGGAIRTRLVAEGLRIAGRVTIVPISWSPWSDACMDAVRAERFAVRDAVLQRPQQRRLSATLLRNISGKYLNTDDRMVDATDRATVLDLARRADVVWIHGVAIANALNTWRWERTVLDVDDLMSRYNKARASYDHGIERARAMWQSRRWKSRETYLLERFDRVVVCSEEDKHYLGAGDRVHVIPNSFECATPPRYGTHTGPPRFGFVGTMRWEPNRDAVRWFARDVMPLISRVSPTADFRVVGREGQELLQSEGLTGTALGYLEDPTEEMATWTAMVVPVRFGGGTRVKIAESFARGIPVVSTRLGAFGYKIEHRRELMLADSPQEFAAACLEVASDPALAVGIAARATECFIHDYSPASMRARVSQLVSTTLAH